MADQSRATESSQGAGTPSAAERYGLPRLAAQRTVSLNANLKDTPGQARWKQFKLEDGLAQMDLNKQPETELDLWYRSVRQQELGQRKAAEACDSTIFVQAQALGDANGSNQVQESKDLSDAIHHFQDMSINDSKS